MFEEFNAANEGSKHRAGDAGPWRINTLKFNKNSVKDSDTQPITGIGYISETTYAKLNRKGQLIVGSVSTSVPLGILCLDQDYKCIYDRLVESK